MESIKHTIKEAAQAMQELVVVVDYPTPFEGGTMAEDHGAPESGQLPRVWTRGRRETESRQRVSGAKSP